MNRTNSLLAAVFLIIGLIGGFFGGFSYRNFTAQEGATTPLNVDQSSAGKAPNIVHFASEPGDQSGLFGDLVMTAIGEGLQDYFKDLGNGSIQKGVESVVTSNTTSNLTIPQNIADTILRQAAEKAVAADKCSSFELGWATNRIRDAYVQYYSGQDDFCTESIILTGGLEVSIYEANFYNTLVYRIKFHFIGTSHIVRWQRGQTPAQCKRLEFDEQYSKKGTVLVDPIGSNIWPWEDPPMDGFKLICTGTTSVRIEIRNPKFSWTKCCGQDPAATPSTSPRT